MASQEQDLVVAASFEEVATAVEAVDLDAPWQDVTPGLRLALPRRRPMPPGCEDLPTRRFPPGIDATLAVDIGPAMLFVNDELLAKWGVTVAAAFGQALDNVRERVRAQSQRALLHERIGDTPTIAFQSREGWASTLLLLPDELGRVLGDRDGLILAPMRDLVLRLPLDADPDLARYILEEFAAADMNALDVPVLGFIDGRLSNAVGVREPTGRSGTMH